MSAAELLRRFVAILEASQVPYMVAGSFASTFHGVPRATHDIDLVIDPTVDTLAALLVSLPELEYYVDADVARDALSRRSQFNVIDLKTGWKLDLIIRKSRAFSIEEFRRRTKAELLGIHVHVATAEDVIISKLEWAKLGDSERQLRDVEGILATCGSTLDLEYIEGWIRTLDLAPQWARVQPQQ